MAIDIINNTLMASLADIMHKFMMAEKYGGHVF